MNACIFVRTAVVRSRIVNQLLMLSHNVHVFNTRINRPASFRPAAATFHNTMQSDNNSNQTSSAATVDRTYEAALVALDALTQNASAQLSAATRRPHRTDNTSRATTELYYTRSGLQLAQLDELSVIHVTGTKGKGSTCALTESILRHCGVRTGFFSSPHLVAVEERFRIDGQPIARETFARHFWHVHDVLLETRQHPGDMPFYFQFLTVMAFHVFRAERVDCAIVEVGIGGEHDCTNIVRGTRTAACTALGLEHTQMLGDTLAEIAWQKAGVAKAGGRLFSDRQPAEGALVLAERCAERGAQLCWVPLWSEYRWPAGVDCAAIHANPACRLNGSLALQLSYDWMRRNVDRVRLGSDKLVAFLRQASTEGGGEADVQMGLDVFAEVAQGMLQCRWPGRFQQTQYRNCRLFIDGAHTVESLRLCVDWFRQQTADSANRKFLLFNVTGNRNAPMMLQVINETVTLQAAFFSPNVARTSEAECNANDRIVLQANADYWKSLRGADAGVAGSDDVARVFASVEQVFQYLEKQYGGADEAVDVLVTGSLYMVGAMCELVESD